MSEAPVRVLLAEDHTLVREGLRSLLDPQEGIEVVAEAETGTAAVARARELRPDVVVMDLNLPGIDGVEATKQIRGELPDTRVVVLSMHSTPEHVRPAIRAGAGGYLVKGSGLSDLIAAVRAVAAGNAFFSPEVAKIVLEDSKGETKAGMRAPNDLTPREREVLQLVAEGKSSPEIATFLGLSVKTIEGHRGRIMAKLDVHNVAGLVRHAIRIGLVSAD
jgi:DNA-binding NarL/FixJ family response regulator